MNKTQTSTRRHFTPQEKVCILKRHLLEDTPVSDLCDEFGIAPNLFYRWQKEFFENGHPPIAPSGVPARYRHKSPRDEGGRVGFRWSDGSRSWMVLPCQESWWC